MASKDKVIGIVLGAGFSHAVSGQMPLMAAMTRAVIDYVNVEPKYEGLYSQLPDLKDNIEDLLSYLSLRQPWHTEPVALRNRAMYLDLSQIIREAIRDSLRQTLEEIQNFKEGHILNQWFRFLVEHETRIVSFNYDVIVEKLVDIALKQKGSYRRTYPFDIPDIVTRSGVGTWGGPAERSKLFLYKLHGSLNWLYSGSEKFFGEQIFDCGIEELERNPSAPLTSEQRPAYRSGADKIPLIVPPTFTKAQYFQNETVLEMWRAGVSALSACSKIYFIGYSLPESDILVKYMLRTINLLDDAEIFVVNPDPEVKQRYVNAFGRHSNLLKFDFVDIENGLDLAIKHCMTNQ